MSMQETVEDFCERVRLSCQEQGGEDCDRVYQECLENPENYT